ncbi:helix-turn-helix domain-containing protein [Methylomarinum vadi]|uniref:helix-turn-helix domain-containing protein n=1 Tax=Methylomarinum vadi TaxID=438855 RepID=UPI001F34F561|nr:helix-turn-helix domain-containing protein [Methylomarinum vadi]
MTQKVTLTDDELVDQTTAGRLLCIPPATLQKWRSTGENNIPFVKIGRNVRYRTVDLREYIERHTKRSGVAA